MSLSMNTLPSKLPAGAHCAQLPGLRLIQASGADAFTFLHAQFTQDVLGLEPGQARLGGYCSAKGRMQASFVFWRHELDDGTACVRALVDASLAERFLQRLRMFVLRAKVTLEILDAEIFGVWADHLEAAEALAAALGDPALPPWAVTTVNAELTYVSAPLAGATPAVRWWRIGPATAASDSCDASAEQWQAQDVAAGLPWITADVHELLTPQMANFDLIEGVSFTKGCYPGQEVVARSHYRGRVKRRTLLGSVSATAIQAGADIYNGAAADAEPIGRVINAARTAAGPSLVLFEAPLDALAADLRLDAGDGPQITLLDLPYSLGLDTP